MRINDRLIRLMIERKALINKVVNIAESMRDIPQSKHIKMNVSAVRISELSADEQSKVIRFTHKERK